jgi:peptide deformylase
MLDIVTLGDEVLKEKCTPVKTFDNGLRLLVDAMFETLVEADGVGLAAPQVGILKRLFVVEIRDEVKQAFINPQIIQTSVETCVMEEGCLSIPGIWHDVTRPEKITVQAQGVDGKPFTVTAEGLYARTIQHEYDHLDGVLFIDHLGKEEEEKIVASYERKHRKVRKKRKV